MELTISGILKATNNGMRQQLHLSPSDMKVYYIRTEIYTPKRIEIKIVSLRLRSQLIGHTNFSLVKNDVSTL